MQVRVNKVQQTASTQSLYMSVSSFLNVAFATVALVMIVTARFAERFVTRWGITGCALRGALQDFSDMAAYRLYRWNGSADTGVAHLPSAR
tara:strand:+ start:134 stop:406 length:273 start_codon:yes stop_codon:yes gene_type:complete